MRGLDVHKALYRLGEFAFAVNQVGQGKLSNVQAIPRFLHRVRYDLVLQTADSTTKVVGRGEPFAYFA